MENRWLSKDEEKIVKKDIIWEIPPVLIPGILIVGLLGVALYLDPKVCIGASVIFLPVAGVLFYLALRAFRDLKRITEKRYVIKEFEVLDTRTGYAAGKTNHYVTLREVNTDKVEKMCTGSNYYVFENNNFVNGIEIEGRKKRIYFERKE